jgi:ABC-type branched-subunit amino acid transport system permease subunit/ABC-type branched-subunit amino acid transport system ATPase component
MRTSRASDRKRFWAVVLAAMVALVVFPQVAPSEAISLGFIALQYALFALGLNIVVGWTGLLDLGAAGFVAVGAYTAAICLTRFGWPPLTVLLASVFAGFTAGVFLGIPTLRHRMDYFAILTLGFAELVALTIRNWPSVTRGSYGYSGIPALRLPFMGEPLHAVPPTGYFYLLAVILVVSYAALLRLRATALGRHFHVIRYSEEVAKAYGVNVLAVKLIAFGLSASLLSVGGFFWATYQRSIVWTEFGILLSCLFVSTLVVGGLGNPTGVVVGAGLVGTSLEVIRRLLTSLGLPQNIRFLLFAVTLVVFVHLRPRGLLPDRPAWFSRFRPGRQTLTAVADLPPIGAGLLLEVNDVARSFGGVVALDGLSLRLEVGECIALIGANGSGKTTLLNILSGFVRADRGEVRLSGKRIISEPSYRIARWGLGRSFQDVSVIDDISVGDNVFISARRPTPEKVAAVLNFFSLGDPLQPCSNLSYGARKALDLARLFVEPERWRLVILDEPTAGLTEGEAMKVVSSLSQLRHQAGLAMIIVSHDIKFLEALKVDRVLVLHQGRLFKEGEFWDIREDIDVRRLFWGDEESIRWFSSA